MVKLLDKDVPTPVVVGAALAAPLVLRAGSKLLSGAPRVVQNGKFKGQPLPADVYDAVIVGAGPSGSTCAHFFAKASPAKRNSGAAARHMAALRQLGTHCVGSFGLSTRLWACIDAVYYHRTPLTPHFHASGGWQGCAAGQGDLPARQVLRCGCAPACSCLATPDPRLHPRRCRVHACDPHPDGDGRHAGAFRHFSRLLDVLSCAKHRS